MFVVSVHVVSVGVVVGGLGGGGGGGFLLEVDPFRHDLLMVIQGVLLRPLSSKRGGGGGVGDITLGGSEE